MKNKKILIHFPIIILIIIFMYSIWSDNDILVILPEITTAPDSSVSVTYTNLPQNTHLDGTDDITVSGTERIPESTSEITPIPVVTKELEDIEITLNFAGDFLMHDSLIKNARKNDETYDFSHLFNEIAYIMKDADYTIANLETTFSGSEAGYSGYPRFNCPDELADAMKNIMGIDMLLTANNHCNDKGYDGLLRTIEIIRKYGMVNTGTYADTESAEKPQIIDIKGIKVSFLNYTYSLNGLRLT